ncbi:RNA polymerase II mediator complex subunit [Neonectria punicea]|uniref:Mediator of RNA polymerase II transcription subunit 12 n=1 Tax=Neonectria punicea TaxID=979145 RepID=A0ABR1GPN2_9HYPO
MTSRTPMGVQPRPPQRTVSSSSLPVQRPPQQRSLSQQHQQFMPASPVRKDSSFIDLTSDSTDVAPNRFAPTPRRGGSRLKVELSNELSTGHISMTGSPQNLTPSRMLPVSDTFETNTSSPAVSRTSHQDLDNMPMPMPRRRPRASQPISVPKVVKPAPAPTTIKKDSRPKPYTVEIPPLAPRFITARPDAPNRTPVDPFSKGLSSGYADFFPWNGAHHEDEWSGEAITKGTWDKVNLNVPETASAKLTIFPALKQKSGLNALSTIFMGVLNQRRHRGQINAPSTFKPPPRVTLTDTKREVWLKDLANPIISLRRLSRTIPHGIRGRTLLDQCLNKNVPTERAVWLAKCVGANEIRAFKRKGVNGAFVMGGELKWARDWTVFVEQFVDAVVSAFGESEWKARVTYAVRLATNLYSEQLLDRDHYLDWVVSGVENSPQSRLPMWILIAQIYWRDLMRSRKYGRRLSFALLSHLHVIHNDPDQDILVQLSSRLAALLSSLLRTNPESFVYPSVWPKYRDTLQDVLSSDDETMQNTINAIQIRNSRLLISSSNSLPAGRNQLVKMLDAALKEPIDRELASKCWAMSDSKPLIIKTLVEWATSFHRPGLAKVYVAANLIRAWSPFRVNPTTAILEILDGIATNDKTRKELVYLLVTELVRTGQFSVPQYIQWVIARGGYHDAADIDPDEGPCSTRLLVELPLHVLSEKRRAERGNLLRRAGNYSIADEEQNIMNAVKCLKHSLGLLLPPDDPLYGRKPLVLHKLLRKIRNSSKALRSCVGAQLRDILTGRFSRKDPSPMSLSMFTSVREIMEAVEDFTMLSDVLKASSKSGDPEILASCADTINSNLQIFLAIGSAENLFNSLIQRLKSINQEQGIVPRPLLAALSALARRMAGHEEIAHSLSNELLQSDRNNAIDACSPVSDIMATTPAQSAEGEVAEEIEKLLSSGTRLDPPTMNRLFRTIIPRLERGWAKKDDARRIFATLLARTRVFDAQHFDKLMTDWTSHVRSMAERPRLSDLFPLLISTGCLAMPIILGTASAPSSSSTMESAAKQYGSATYLQELLQLIITPLPEATGLSPEESYRFRTEQRCAKSEQSKGLLNLVKNALLEYSGLRHYSKAIDLPLDNAPCQESLLETLRLLVLVDSTGVSHALSLKSLPEAGDLIQKVTTNLLVPGEPGESFMSFDRILQLANELTLPFCQLKLNLDLSMSQQHSGGGDEHGSRFDLFAKAMDRAIEAGNIMWTSLLPCLSEDITQHLKSQAQNSFLDLIPSTKATNLTESASNQSIHMAENLLEVVEAIVSGHPPPKTAQLSIAMVEKLADLWEIIAGGSQEQPGVHAAALQHWLPAMLRFVTLHSLSSEPPSAPLPTASATRPPIPAGHDTRARIVLVLCGLMLELETLPPSTTGSLPQQVMDMAILLVDALPEDLRAQCAKSILLTPGSTPSLSTSSDPRLYYLFSAPHPGPAEHLMLSHREKPATAHSAAARGMGAMYGIGPAVQERLSPFVLRRWELLSEPTPNVGENDTSLSLGLFEAIKIQ